MMMLIMIKIIMLTITVMVMAVVAMMMMMLKRSVIKHHDLQTRGRSGGITPCIINLHGSERLAEAALQSRMEDMCPVRLELWRREKYFYLWIIKLRTPFP
jgi:hypothetical protein